MIIKTSKLSRFDQGAVRLGLCLLLLGCTFCLDRLIAYRARLVYLVKDGYKFIAHIDVPEKVRIGPVEEFVLQVPGNGRLAFLAVLYIFSLGVFFVGWGKRLWRFSGSYIVLVCGLFLLLWLG